MLPGSCKRSVKSKLHHFDLLVYRRARGDMIEVYKTVHGYYDTECVPYLPVLGN